MEGSGFVALGFGVRLVFATPNYTFSLVTRIWEGVYDFGEFGSTRSACES